jgi:hypothetical protein
VNSKSSFPWIASRSVDDAKDHHIAVNGPHPTLPRKRGRVGWGPHKGSAQAERFGCRVDSRFHVHPWEIARSVRIRTLFAHRTELRRVDFPLEYRPKSHQARRAQAWRIGPSCPSMFGKDGFYFLIRRNLTVGYGRNRLINRPEFLASRPIDTVPSRLDFEGDLCKLILVVLRPMRDPRQHMFHIRIHGSLFSTTSVLLHVPAPFPAQRANYLRRPDEFPAHAIKIPCAVWAGNRHECTGIAA